MTQVYKVVNNVDGKLLSSNSYFLDIMNVEYKVGIPAEGLMFGEVRSRLFVFIDLELAKEFARDNLSMSHSEIWLCEAEDVREDIRPIEAIPSEFCEYWHYVDKCLKESQKIEIRWKNRKVYMIQGAHTCSRLTLIERVL